MTETMQSKLTIEEENHRLKALTASFAEVNSSLDMKTVLSNTLSTAAKLMHAETGSITLINDEGTCLRFAESTDPNFEKLKELSIPLGKGIIGWVAQTGKSIRADNVRNDSRFYQEIDKEMGHTTGSYICSPLIVHNRIIGTAQIMNHRNEAPFKEADVQLLEGFAGQAALAIENARSHELEIKQQSIEHEMRLCADIQTNIFPKTLPSIAGFEVHGSSTPAKEVGGDYYNYFQYNDNCMDLLVADIAGKGVSAALIVTQLHTCYQLLASAEKALEQTAKELNEFLCSALVLGRFITLFIGRIYADRKEMEYVLAGHPPPILIQKADRPPQKFVRTAPILGIDRNIVPKVKKIFFFPGDLLAAFSDGYSEALNKEEKLFGEERISRIISQNAKENLENIYQALQDEVNAFRGDVPFADDVTLLLLRRGFYGSGRFI